MSLLTQFYPGPGGGGSSVVVDPTSPFSGGIAPGGMGQIYMWGPSSNQSFSAGTIAGTASVQGLNPNVSSQYGAGFSVFTIGALTSGGIPFFPGSPTLGLDTGARYLVSNAKYVSFVNLAIFPSSGATNVGIQFDNAHTVSGLSMGLTNDSTPFLTNSPNLVTLENCHIGVGGSQVTFTAPNLANVETSYFSWRGSGQLNWPGASLTVASVTRVIDNAYEFEQTGTAINPSINLSGGSSAPAGSLSAATQAKIAALVASGWSITLNT